MIRTGEKASKDQLPALVRNLRRVPRAPGAISEGRQPEVGDLRDAVYRRLLAVADVLSACVAVLIAVVALGEGDRLTAASLALLPLVVLVSKVAGLYERDQYLLHKATVDELPKLFQVATFYTLLLWLTEGIFIEGHLGRDQTVALWALLFACMALGRALARLVARVVTPAERILVLGDRTAAARLKAKAERSGSTKLAIVGRLSFGAGRRRGEEQLGDGTGEAVPVLGVVGELHTVLREEAIDRVVIAPGPLPSDDVLDLISLAKFLGAKVSVLPSLFEVVGTSVEFDDVEGMTVLGLRRYGLSRSSAVLKRGMDVVGAGAALLLFTPLLALIAVAIRLDSRGPVVFRQRRIGKGDREIEILKFRTMVDGAEDQRDALAELNEAEGLFKISDDPRLTRVGRLLRRAALDELPQLFNVLRGEMSLVGPRPLVPDEDVRVEGWHRRRLEVPPGMTGHWQVLGSARVPLHDMVKIDYLYGANWSLWGDLKILLRTVPFVFKRRGL